MNRKFAIAIPLLAIAISGILVFAVDTYNKSKNGNGHVKNIGIEIYDLSMNPIETIEWYDILESETKYYDVYIKNIKSDDITLSYSTNSWNPTNAVDYLTTGWNYSGEVIGMSQRIPIRLSLTCASNVEGIGDFSFIYNFTATEELGGH